MKRKLLAVIMTILLVGTMFTACSKEEKTDDTQGTTEDTTAEVTAAPEVTAAADSDSTAEVSTEPVTLKVWESTGGPDEFIKQAGKAFTAKYPNITIEYVNVELGDAATQIALDGPAGVGPDLFAAPHDKLGELVSGGHVMPTANADTVKSSVLGACSTALTYDGTMYGYPVSAETYALFYNKALISEDQVPTSWDDLVAFSKTFNAANSGKYGFMMDVANGYYTIIFTTSDDNRLFGPSGTDTTNTNINSVASVKGMEFFKGLREILDIPSADLTTSICDAAFSSGNVAMYITGLWNVSNFEGAGIDFGVAALPSLPGNSTPVASFSGTRSMFVSSYTNYPEEAALFGEFLLSEDMQKLRFDITGSLPSIATTVDSPYISGFLKQLDYAFPMPSIPQMGAFWDAMNAASANIWDGADIQAELDACNSTILGQ
jgi:arabinogalactan oligomer/maltooligosaccharide transport system substrate-binding protein